MSADTTRGEAPSRRDLLRGRLSGLLRDDEDAETAREAELDAARSRVGGELCSAELALDDESPPPWQRHPVPTTRPRPTPEARDD